MMPVAPPLAIGAVDSTPPETTFQETSFQLPTICDFSDCASALAGRTTKSSDRITLRMGPSPCRPGQFTPLPSCFERVAPLTHFAGAGRAKLRLPHRPEPRMSRFLYVFLVAANLAFAQAQKAPAPAYEPSVG